MRRLILTLAAAVTVAGSAAVVDTAEAQGRGNGRGERAERNWERSRGGYGRAPREQRQRNYDRERSYGDRGERSYGAPPRASVPYGYGPPPGYSMRRGGYLPPTARGGEVNDYGRFRLRPPPPGYAWVRVGDDYLLVSRRNGQIFDVIRP